MPAKAAGWIPTGLNLKQGDRLIITAHGRISFWAYNYVRTPDGLDEHGQFQPAEANCPAPTLRRNSLVFRIGGWVFQGGSSVEVIVQQNGPLEMSNNDNMSGDNDGCWQIALSVGAVGRLETRMLVVLQSPSITHHNQWTPYIETVEQYRRCVYAFSNQRHVVHVTHAILPQGVSEEEYADYDMPNWSARFQSWVNQWCASNKQAPFDAVCRLYEYGDPHHSHKPKMGALTWGAYRYTCIPLEYGFQNVPGAPMPQLVPQQLGTLRDLLVHEYLHHLDHHAQQAGVTEFVDPDKMLPYAADVNFNNHTALTPSLATTREMIFYERTMRWIDTRPVREAVPYALLDGRLGRWV